MNQKKSGKKFLQIETKWLVLLTVGIGTFMSALDGSIVSTILPVITEYFHTDVSTIDRINSSIFCGFIFVFQNRKHIAAPMLDLRLFKRKIFTISTISPVLNYICIYSVIFLVPFYLIHGRSLNASHAGLILTSQPFVMAITAPLSGSLSDRIGSRIPTTLGMLIFAVGLFLLGNSTTQTHFSIIVIGLATCGLGTGLFVSPNNSTLMGDAPRNRQGIASGILALSRNVGMVLGIGLTGAIFTTFLGLGNPYDPYVLTHAFDMGLFFVCGVASPAAIITFMRGNDRPEIKHK